MGTSRRHFRQYAVIAMLFPSFVAPILACFPRGCTEKTIVFPKKMPSPFRAMRAGKVLTRESAPSGRAPDSPAMLYCGAFSPRMRFSVLVNCTENRIAVVVTARTSATGSARKTADTLSGRIAGRR